MILAYKILHGFQEGVQWQDFFQMADTSRLQRHPLKLRKDRLRLDLLDRQGQPILKDTRSNRSPSYMWLSRSSVVHFTIRNYYYSAGHSVNQIIQLNPSCVHSTDWHATPPPPVALPTSLTLLYSLPVVELSEYKKSYLITDKGCQISAFNSYWIYIPNILNTGMF